MVTKKNKNMKVVHLFWGMSYGGIETMLVNIVNEQVKTGIDVYVILVNDLKSNELVQRFHSCANVIFLNRKIGSKSIGFVFKLNSLLKRINPHVIHLHGSEFCLFLKSEFRDKVLFTMHALPFGKIVERGWIKRILHFLYGEKGNVFGIESMPIVVSISNAVKDLLEKSYNVKSTLINNGICSFNFKKKSISTDLFVGNKIFRIVQVGRLFHEEKGQDILIKALASLKGNYQLTFIGSGSSENYLKKMVESYKLQKKVIFLGSVSQDFLQNNLKNYDLYVQPSRTEGFGLTVVEAMAARLPVLVSSGQGPSEIIKNDVYGWVFENGDESDLARQIESIVESYDEAMLKADKALSYVEEMYDVSVTAKKYVDIYNSIVLCNK